MSQDSLCVRCVHLLPALDPNIQKAFLGRCLKREWPFTLSIPLEGWKECEVFAASGHIYVPPSAMPVTATAAPTAAKAVRRLEFYYSRAEPPGDAFPCDVAVALALVRELQARGIDVRAIDVSGVKDRFPIYHRAVSGPVAEVRPVFGMKGALVEDFGGRVPALLIYAGDRYPVEVFPRMDKTLGRVMTVEEALQRELPDS
jgi:hypothetical protein